MSSHHRRQSLVVPIIFGTEREVQSFLTEVCSRYTNTDRVVYKQLQKNKLSNTESVT